MQLWKYGTYEHRLSSQQTRGGKNRRKLIDSTFSISKKQISKYHIQLHRIISFKFKNNGNIYASFTSSQATQYQHMLSSCRTFLLEVLETACSKGILENR